MSQFSERSERPQPERGEALQRHGERAAVGLRQLNIEARRQRILAAARTLIAEGGMTALSMRRLARAADVSVTTLYNLYGERAAILQALVDDAIDRMDRVLELEAPLDDPLERCRAVITVSIRHLADAERIFRPMLLAANHERAALGRGDRITARAARMQAVAIEAAIAKGWLTPTLDSELLGRQIYHGYEYASAQWAEGLLDVSGFETRALYGLYVALLGVATPASRARIEAELVRLEAQQSKRRKRPTRS